MLNKRVLIFGGLKQGLRSKIYVLQQIWVLLLAIAAKREISISRFYKVPLILLILLFLHDKANYVDCRTLSSGGNEELVSCKTAFSFFKLLALLGNSVTIYIFLNKPFV